MQQRSVSVLDVVLKRALEFVVRLVPLTDFEVYQDTVVVIE